MAQAQASLLKRHQLTVKLKIKSRQIQIVNRQIKNRQIRHTVKLKS